MLQGDKSLVVQRAEVGLVGTINVVVPIPSVLVAVGIGHGVGDEVSFFGIDAHGVAHRNLAILGIGAVVDDFAFRTKRAIVAHLLHHLFIFVRLGKRPRNCAAVAAAPTHCVHTHRKVVAFVVELVAIIQATVGKVIAVPSIAAFAKISRQRVGDKFFAEHRHTVGVFAPIRPTAEPNIDAVCRIYFIIKTEVATRIEVFAVVSRSVNFVAGQKMFLRKQRLVNIAITLPDRIATIDIGVERQLVIRPNV